MRTANARASARAACAMEIAIVQTSAAADASADTDLHLSRNRSKRIQAKASPLLSCKGFCEFLKVRSYKQCIGAAPNITHGGYVACLA